MDLEQKATAFFQINPALLVSLLVVIFSLGMLLRTAIIKSKGRISDPRGSSKLLYKFSRSSPLSFSSASLPAVVAKSTTAQELSTIDNIRDISEINPSVRPHLILRSACPLAASEHDAIFLKTSYSLGHLIDLRAAEEIKDDDDTSSLKRDLGEDLWYERPKGNRVTAKLMGLLSARPAAPLRLDAVSRSAPTAPPSSTGRSGESSGNGNGLAMDPVSDADAARRPLTRHVLSLLDRRRFIRALMTRLPLATLTQVLVRQALDPDGAKRVMMKEVNAGGLELLYEIVLESSGPELNQTLRLLTDHAVRGQCTLVYCKAGKDRTGVVMALVHSILGTPRDAIVQDYAMSDNFKRVALAGMEKQGQDLAGVDRDRFSGAPPSAMERTLAYVDDKYGGVEEYLDAIDFTAEWRARMRKALLA